MTFTETNQELFIGIDIAKASIDIAGLNANKVLHLPYNEEAIDSLVKTLLERKASCIVMEATGGLEMPLASALYEAALPVCIINPKRVRDFAKSTGLLAKSDRIDAKLLVRFATALRPEPKPIPDAAAQALKALLQRRRQLLQMATMEKNRLSACQDSVIGQQIQTHLVFLKEGVTALETELSGRIEQNQIWREKQERLGSVPGVGPVTSQMLVSHLPELGTLSGKEVSALCGVAPHCRESGNWQGTRQVYGGRAEIRAVLYMATLTATQHNPWIKNFYQRLLSKGKKKKVALVACMRKLLVILNALLKHKVAWQENYACAVK